MPNHYFLKITDVDLIDELFVYFLIVASIIFLLVVFFTFFYLFRYGVKKRPERPSQKVGNGNVEYFLATLVTIITGVFVYLTIVTMGKVQTIPENPRPFLEITGHQWWWEAKYPNSGVITSNQIYIPTGKKILLKFYKKLFGKLDIIATKDSDVVLTINQGSKNAIEKIYGKKSIPTYMGIDMQKNEPDKK